jgi:Heparinase II/III-like protein/Heparinase II/III N-terminus
VKLRTLTNAWRNEPLPILIREAGWRGIRSIRRSLFRPANPNGICPVRFQPIGYYRLQKQGASREGHEAILAYADAILRGEYPLLGYGRPPLGTPPDWHGDWVSQTTWPVEASGKIQIVRHDGSDVKAPWELSRLQWSPVVAKAYVLTGDQRYRESLRSLLTDWMARNPVGQGVNWTIAMEAALRGISLCLTMDLLSPFSEREKPWLEQMTASLWQHLRFIEAHSEFSFRLRSNHYLSNIVGLTTLSAYLHGPGVRCRAEKYAQAVQREILLQTYADGGDREASTGYHVLVAQMGLHSLLVQQRCGISIGQEFEARLRRMFAWITALADEGRQLPHLGDCDNGRVELLQEDISQAMQPARKRHSLRIGSLCGLASHLLHPPLGGAREDAVWFGCTTEEAPRERGEKPVTLLLESGIAVLQAREASVVFTAMPNGLQGRGSHTHCDKLSVVFRLGQHEVFCDSGSRWYTRSAERRNLDRSTRAHNTLFIDEAEQNMLDTDPDMLFQCGNEAAVSPIAELGGNAVRASHWGYSRFGIEHRRTVQLSEGSMVLIDEVVGGGTRSLDLRFVLGPEWSASSEMMTGETVTCAVGGPRRLSLVCEAQSELRLSVLPVEISREYGSGLPASCIRIHTKSSLPARLQTQVRWD